MLPGLRFRPSTDEDKWAFEFTQPRERTVSWGKDGIGQGPFNPSGIPANAGIVLRGVDGGDVVHEDRFLAHYLKTVRAAVGDVDEVGIVWRQFERDVLAVGGRASA